NRQQLDLPTRCEGWSVGDVTAHVVGTLADVTGGRIEGQGTDEVTARQVEERRGRTAAELADELALAVKSASDLLPAFDDVAWLGAAPGGYDLTLGDAIEALWYDAYLHADDIGVALGRPTRRGDGLVASVSHISAILDARGAPRCTVALDGMPRFEVSGGGAEITGDALTFVLEATGRATTTTTGVGNIYG
ncbi:MAG TPA: maleylpyruvate isomerase family mycothiol-dependent enzyme, partial [Acidimicrobiales bacterium]|nr:maleylpyruvate isomerase family mycothiol-dependent enzyme [Acidimicrobiales bacterium]